jgi:hypothetical protein
VAIHNVGVDTDPVIKDGGPSANEDAGPPDAVDAGPTCGTADGGIVETRVPDINNMTAECHPAEGSRVHFKGVVMAPSFRLRVKAYGDMSTWECIDGVYLADSTGGGEYNGLIVATRGTYDTFNAKCNDDSLMYKLQASSKFALGEELEITGDYSEYCFVPVNATECPAQWQNSPITLPEVMANGNSAIVRTGRTPGVPTSLPVKISIADIFSTYANTNGGRVITGLGANWFRYRAVLARLENVKVNDYNTFATVWWNAAQADNPGTQEVVITNILSGIGRQPLGSVFDSLQGFPYFEMPGTQFWPRSSDDAQPPLN